MSEVTPINGVTAMKLQAAQEGKALAKGWIKAMSDHGMACMLFYIVLPGNDAGSFMVGNIEREIDSLGHEIAHMSHAVLGHDGKGNNPAIHFVFMIRSKDGKRSMVTL